MRPSSADTYYNIDDHNKTDKLDLNINRLTQLQHLNPVEPGMLPSFDQMSIRHLDNISGPQHIQTPVYYNSPQSMEPNSFIDITSPPDNATHTKYRDYNASYMAEPKHKARGTSIPRNKSYEIVDIIYRHIFSSSEMEGMREKKEGPSGTLEGSYRNVENTHYQGDLTPQAKLHKVIDSGRTIDWTAVAAAVGMDSKICRKHFHEVIVPQMYECRLDPGDRYALIMHIIKGLSNGVEIDASYLKQFVPPSGKTYNSVVLRRAFHNLKRCKEVKSFIANDEKVANFH